MNNRVRAFDDDKLMFNFSLCHGQLYTYIRDILTIRIKLPIQRDETLFLLLFSLFFMFSVLHGIDYVIYESCFSFKYELLAQNIRPIWVFRF